MTFSGMFIWLLMWFDVLCKCTKSLPTEPICSCALNLFADTDDLRKFSFLSNSLKLFLLSLFVIKKPNMNVKEPVSSEQLC